MALTRRANDDAFTLIELLVVVLIIGILSAIAVPLFLGQQDRAKDAQAINELGLAANSLMLYATANEGTYTTSLTDLEDYGYASTEPVTGTHIDIVDADANQFCIEAISSTGQTFRIASGGGIVPGACP